MDHPMRQTFARNASQREVVPVFSFGQQQQQLNQCVNRTINNTAPGFDAENGIYRVSPIAIQGHDSPNTAPINMIKSAQIVNTAHQIKTEGSLQGYPLGPRNQMSQSQEIIEIDVDSPTKSNKEGLSPRVLEKRRRDRMNNCLLDLGRLIPTSYSTKNRGRIEKTEIIELAVKYLRHLQVHNTSDISECQYIKMNEEERSREYKKGFRDCVEETVKYLAQTEGITTGDNFCVRLVNHLLGHLEKSDSDAQSDQGLEGEVAPAENNTEVKPQQQQQPSLPPQATQPTMIQPTKQQPVVPIPQRPQRLEMQQISYDSGLSFRPILPRVDNVVPTSPPAYSAAVSTPRTSPGSGTHVPQASAANLCKQRESGQMNSSISGEYSGRPEGRPQSAQSQNSGSSEYLDNGRSMSPEPSYTCFKKRISSRFRADLQHDHLSLSSSNSESERNGHRPGLTSVIPRDPSLAPYQEKAILSPLQKLLELRSQMQLQQQQQQHYQAAHRQQMQSILKQQQQQQQQQQQHNMFLQLQKQMKDQQSQQQAQAQMQQKHQQQQNHIQKLLLVQSQGQRQERPQLAPQGQGPKNPQVELQHKLIHAPFEYQGQQQVHIQVKGAANGDNGQRPKSDPSTRVPGFGLHPSGSFYVPIKMSENVFELQSTEVNPLPILYPINIMVDFTRSFTLNAYSVQNVT